jgi:beta-glucosidase/6-phospho-beta-glucosidase/beta-galactosidase
VRDPARAIQACHHVFIAHALAVKAFREMGVAGEIGFVNVLQPHTASPTVRKISGPPTWLTPSIPTGSTIRY